MKTNNALSLWRDTWSPVSEFRREFDRLFDDWASPSNAQVLRAEQSFVPACDVEESDDHYLLTLEMAGIRKDDIKLEVNDGQLTISGERRNEAKQDGQWYSERRFGKFQRTFSVPVGIDADRVEANYQDGILRVMVPKAESAKPRQIKITNGTVGSKFFGRLLNQPKETKDEVRSSNDYSKPVAS